MQEQGGGQGVSESGQLWKVNQAARYLGMSPSWVYKAARRGAIPVVRIGAALRFDSRELYEWVRDSAKRPAKD